MDYIKYKNRSIKPMITGSSSSLLLLMTIKLFNSLLHLTLSKSSRQSLVTPTAMFKNLIKISLRNLLRDKAYSVINILGLTIGITCSLFLLMYILDELSYDRYHVNANNIYRIVSNIKEPDNAFTWAVVQKPMAVELRDNYPEVKNAVRFDGMNRNLYKNGDRQFYEDDFFLADSTVFDMFSYTFLAGDPGTALDNPFSIVLTETVAKKNFSNPRDTLDQTLLNQQEENFKI